MIVVFCFCFKQKTADAMRISDWSSDVCSSDLLCPERARSRGPAFRPVWRPISRGRKPLGPEPDEAVLAGRRRVVLVEPGLGQHLLAVAQVAAPLDRLVALGRQVELRPPVAGHVRSEEHTSELQSLMRISYAGFCLQKNTK